MNMDQVPENLRLKAQKLAADRIEAARRDALRRSERISAKRLREIAAKSTGTSIAREVKRRAWNKINEHLPQGTPTYDLPEYGGPPWDEYYTERIPTNEPRFTPREGYTNSAYSEATEGLQDELIENYGVPPESAGDVASNVVDKWIKIVRPEEQPSEPAAYLPDATRPQFKVHPFSPVDYMSGDSMAQGFSGYDEGGRAYFGQVPVVHEEIIEEQLPIALPDSDAGHTPITTPAAGELEQAVRQKDLPAVAPSPEVLNDIKKQNAGRSVVPLAVVAGLGLVIYATLRKPR